jgi:hypothetical protein
MQSRARTRSVAVHCKGSPHPSYNTRCPKSAEEWASTLLLYSTKNFKFQDMRDHPIPYIEVLKDTYRYRYNKYSYIYRTKSTIKQHQYLAHRHLQPLYSNRHLAHQVFGRRHPTFTLIQDPVRSLLPAAIQQPPTVHPSTPFEVQPLTPLNPNLQGHMGRP